MPTLTIFIHGALSSPLSFTYLKSFVPEADSCFLKYDIKEEPAADTVTRFTAAVRRLLNKRKPERLLLVGHSFGGLLALEVARDLKDELPISIISLASPFGGSTVAAALALIKPKSIMLKNISAYDRFVARVQYGPLPCKMLTVVTVGGSADWIPGPNDGVVAKASQEAFKNDPQCRLVHAPLNHFEVLLSPKVGALIARELAVKAAKGSSSGGGEVHKHVKKVEASVMKRPTWMKNANKGYSNLTDLHGFY